jgi:hypothetical protein
MSEEQDNNFSAYPVPCFECGKPSNHNHHVVPKVHGGKKTIPLCYKCHGIVHDLKFTNHKELIKIGLKKAKARGVKIGANGKNLAKANKAEADKFAGKLAPVIEEIREAGITTGRGIAAELNKREIPTARGGRWHLLTVQRLLNRLAF